MRARVNTARLEPGQIVELAAAKALLPRAQPQTLASNTPWCWAIAARMLAGADARVTVIDRAMSTLVLRPAAGAALQPQEVGR